MADYNNPNDPYIMEDRTTVFATLIPYGYVPVHEASYLVDLVIAIDTVTYDYLPVTITPVGDTVTVTETLVGQSISDTGDASQVTDTITFNITRSPSLVDVAEVSQLVSYILYHKTIPGNKGFGGSGNSGNVFVNPVIVAYENALTPPGHVTFTCTSPSTSIELRKPDFGDNDKFEAFRIQRNTYGGDLEIYQDVIWPIYETFDMTWSYLSETIAHDLSVFLNATEGQIMTFINQFGETFTGYILTPSNKILQPKVNGFSASFTFQVSNEPNTVEAGDQ